MCEEIFIRRCFDLARLARKAVKFNPQVGAVYVKSGQVIAEGYHESYGGSHAERRAIEKFEGKDIEGSEVYVSLEPCSHFGKTPPCADLLIEAKVAKVHVALKDPNPTVNGKGIARIANAGIFVQVGTCRREARQILRPFLTNQLLKRPHIILKWAESQDGFIAAENDRTKISNPYTDRLVHKWRSEIDAIMIGTNTAIIDNPTLSTRFYPGDNPLRIVIDRNNRASDTLRVFRDGCPTLLFTHRSRVELPSQVEQIILPKTDTRQELDFMLSEMYARGISRLMVEGGSQLLKSFLDAGLWDECRRIRSTLMLHSGVNAPQLSNPYQSRTRLLDDVIEYYVNSSKDRKPEAQARTY